MYCILKVTNHLGSEVKAATELSTEIENAEDLNELIENENELRLIADEFNVLQERCLETHHNTKYCYITIEIKAGDEVLVPQTVIKVPSVVEGDLRKFLLHVKDFCTAQMEKFLSNISIDIGKVPYKVPAFFNGDIYEVVSH